MIKTKGQLLVFEGIDGSGKTTQLSRLYNRLRSLNNAADYPPAVVNMLANTIRTAEPAGTKLGRAIQAYQHGAGGSEIVPTAELMLYMAARSQHVHQVIDPYRDKGCLVLCDRFTASTVAYQGYGHERHLGMIDDLNNIVTGGLCVDLTLWIDVPVPMAAERVARRSGDRLDAEYMERVRLGYAAISAAGDAVRIDGAQSIDDVEADIWAVVENQIGLSRPI